jgi:hypothetical protein
MSPPARIEPPDRPARQRPGEYPDYLFQPAAIRPEVLAWDGGRVSKLGQAIYDERRFDDLPILADALEDAGCTDQSILEHLRSPGPHVRGCWVVDLLTERKQAAGLTGPG